MEEIEFDFRVMEEIDFLAIRRFMSHYCHTNIFNSSELVEILLSQGEIGSVIRQLDTIEAFGFISVVNVYQHKEKSCVRQIKKFVVSACNSLPEEEKKKWGFQLEQPLLGLFLNERIVNIPHLVAPQLNQFLFEEISLAVKEGHPYNFDHYLYLARYTTKKEIMEFEKVEDEIYFKHALLKVKMTTTQNCGIAFMIFPATSIPAILKQIENVVAEGYSW
uniref:Uncharacterized protein n=1 Tax=Arcella intermedia TaxID=1963864 RepID=A0A6B2LEA8_9EUKA